MSVRLSLLLALRRRFLSLFPRPRRAAVDPSLPWHLETGRAGEQIAQDYLLASGYAIIATNVRVGSHLEIDCIAHDPVDQVLAFVEVKTRGHLHPSFLPERTAGQVKRGRMQRAARQWVDAHAYTGGYRFDLVVVSGVWVVEHFTDIAVGHEKNSHGSPTW